MLDVLAPVEELGLEVAGLLGARVRDELLQGRSRRCLHVRTLLFR